MFELHDTLTYASIVIIIGQLRCISASRKIEQSEVCSKVFHDTEIAFDNSLNKELSASFVSSTIFVGRGPDVRSRPYLCMVGSSNRACHDRLAGSLFLGVETRGLT